jgi:hypothetical protein
MSLGTGLVIPQPAGDIFVDLTFQKLLGKKTQEFTLYGDTDIAAPVGVNKNTNWKLLLSVGYRF